jgi:hypothetical protein
MLALIYVVTIWCVAAILFVSVHEHEPNRPLALVLEFLILALGTAAISRLLSS